VKRLLAAVLLASGQQQDAAGKERYRLIFSASMMF